MLPTVVGYLKRPSISARRINYFALGDTYLILPILLVENT